MVGASRFKQALKRLRASQPFNGLATSASRGILSALGGQSEFLIRHLHRVGDVESPLPNGRTLRLWSRADDWVSNQVFWRGWRGYEPETSPLFYLLATRAQVTIDVGAYVGFFALLAAHANPEGHVHAFEPLADAFGRLEENVARNRLANVACVRAALGRTEGEADFFHVAGDAMSAISSDGGESIPCSSSLSADFMRDVVGVVGTKVQVRTLDGYLRDQPPTRVDLLKLDTESTEPDVLEGAAALLKTSRPTIFCEVLAGRGTGQRLEALLFPLGYHAYHLTPRGPEHRDRIDGHASWLNYMFTVRTADDVRAMHLEASAGRGVT